MALVGGPLVQLPRIVVDRVPQLRDAHIAFFDYGMLTTSGYSTPIVAALTDTTLVVAPFPDSSVIPTAVLPHASITSVSRDGADVTVRIRLVAELRLQLPKADTFAVLALKLRDRALTHALGLAVSNQRASAPWMPAARSARRMSPAQAADDLGPSVGFGRVVRSTNAPPEELFVGSEIDKAVNDGPLEKLVATPTPRGNSRDLHRRLRHFFMSYDRSKLLFIDEIVAQHRGHEARLMAELEAQYGPEPNKRRWEVHEQMSHQREVNAQLQAQLRRAQDELLLLQHERNQRRRAVQRMQQLKDRFVVAMLAEPHP
jgi:hypothetical protein